MLILDLPPDEEADSGLGSLDGIKRIRLIAPTSTDGRIRQIARTAEGFIYYVSREGVTGEQTDVATTIESRVAAIRKETGLPIAIGFGISTPDQAREVARFGDAVVVGSAIVRRIAEQADAPDLPDRIGAFVKPLVAAVKRA
jgi:tryptophan synthase alpha chain